jgi:hypothetical protein
MIQPELTELVIRRMRPRLAPAWVLALVVLVLSALVWFAVNHG